MSFPAATIAILYSRLPDLTFQADALQPQGFTAEEGGFRRGTQSPEREPRALIPLLTSGYVLLVHKSITIIDWPPISHHASGFWVLAIPLMYKSVQHSVASELSISVFELNVDLFLHLHCFFFLYIY